VKAHFDGRGGSGHRYASLLWRKWSTVTSRAASST
jgi:hypothetical protein